MTTTPLPYWKVLKQPTNGCKIAGKKGRKLNDVFQAAPAMMHMQELEGIVGACNASGVLTNATGTTGGSGTTGGTGSTGGSGGTGTAGH